MKGPSLIAAAVLATSVIGFSQLGGAPVRTSKFRSQEEWKNHVNAFPNQRFKPSQRWFGLAKNQHWQTIVGSGALNKVLFGRELQRSFRVHSRLMQTSDGDDFEVEFTRDHFEEDDVKSFGEDVTPNTEDTRPIVVMLHGLEANAKGGLMTKMAEEFMKELKKEQLGCVLVSFRGCNGKENKTVGAYHLGFTKDVDQLTAFLHKKFPNRPLYLSGFSLGGNVSLKFLGELGSSAIERNLRGAVTMSVPFDLVESGAKIDKGFNKIVYAGNFLQTLIKKAEKQHASFQGKVPFDIDVIRQCKAIGDFDDAFIAPIYGFKDKFDYYLQSQAKGFLRHIQVPCICVNARDDPFIEESSLPTDRNHVDNAPVRLIYTEEGGHCGFVDEQQNDRWISQELARGLAHIHRGYEISDSAQNA
jgi:predicted alpha/beta-fold hydrolase